MLGALEVDRRHANRGGPLLERPDRTGEKCDRDHTRVLGQDLEAKRERPVCRQVIAGHRNQSHWTGPSNEPPLRFASSATFGPRRLPRHRCLSHGAFRSLGLAWYLPAIFHSIFHDNVHRIFHKDCPTHFPVHFPTGMFPRIFRTRRPRSRDSGWHDWLGRYFPDPEHLTRRPRLVEYGSTNPRRRGARSGGSSRKDQAQGGKRARRGTWAPARTCRRTPEPGVSRLRRATRWCAPVHRPAAPLRLVPVRLTEDPTSARCLPRCPSGRSDPRPDRSAWGGCRTRGA